jgi:hypothetical protein
MSLTESQKRARHLITQAMAEHSKTASDKEVLLSFEWVEVLQTIQSSMLMDAMSELRTTEANADEERNALKAMNLIRDLNMESVAGVALEFIGADTWQAYDTMTRQPIADGETPLQAMQAAKKVLTEVTP